MTHPSDFGLLEFATPYALDAVTEGERHEIEQRLASAPNAVAQAFREEVRIVRETMAEVSANTALEPPADLRDRVLSAIAPLPPAEQPPRRPFPWRTTFLAAAAAAVVALAGVTSWLALRPPPTPSTAQQVFAAPDVHTVSGNVGDGTATVVYSRDRDAGVLVMNNVPPPAPGTVYQMWLVRGGQPEPAGTMDAKAVSPSTTAVLSDLGNATALAFTVEPGSGSTRPTSQPIAELALT